MIRINLLASERRAAKAAAPGMQAGQKLMVVGSLLLVLTLALLTVTRLAQETDRGASSHDGAARGADSGRGRNAHDVHHFRIG